MVERTVLLLEANERRLLHLEEGLRGAGFKIVRATSFLEAFQILKAGRKSLVIAILDFEMTTDDPEVLQRMRRLDFDRPLPVVLMGEVALSSAEISQLCSDSGYTGYLYKGMSPKKIIDTLRSILNPENSARRFPRVMLEQRVHCEFDGQTYLTEVFDLSLGGMFLRMNQNLPPVGTMGTANLFIDPQNKFSVKFDVEVIYVCSTKRNVMSIFPAGIGVKFTQLDGQKEQYLKLLIERCMEDVKKQENVNP